MKPLINIQSVPISLEYSVTKAKLEMAQPNAKLNLSREKKGLTIESSPIKINIDTFEARSSAGMKSVRTAIKEQAQEGVRLTYEAIGTIVDDGNFMMDIHINRQPVIALSGNNNDQLTETMMGFSPSVRPEISWIPQNLQMKYEMDKLSFDWRMNRPELTFIPGKIEFQVTQYPEVIIEYIGGPIYVPASADPDYVPLNDEA